MILLAASFGCSEDKPAVDIVSLGPGPKPTEQGDDSADAIVESAYQTHVVAYGNCLANMDQSVLENYDVIIVGPQNLALLEERFRRKAVLYFDVWAKDGYHLGEQNRGWPEWQPGPGDLGQPEISLYPDSYAYRFDDAHVEMFLGWVEDFLFEYSAKVKGIYLDDFSLSRQWWLYVCEDCTEADLDSVWGPWDGRDGWREDPYYWNQERLLEVESRTLELVAAYCGPEGIVIANGTAAAFDATRRFAENAGSENSESWDDLIGTDGEGIPLDERRYLRPGDFLQINAITSPGIWSDSGFLMDSNSGSGWFNLVRACSLATFMDLSVGLAFGEPPDAGGSYYSLFLDPAEVPPLSRSEWPDRTTWPYYDGYIE